MSTKLLYPYLVSTDPIGNATTISTINLDPNYVRWFAGVHFFNNTPGTNISFPDAGTITYQVRTYNFPLIWQDVTNGVVDATQNSQVDWLGNTTILRITLTGVTNFTTYRIYVAGNPA